MEILILIGVQIIFYVITFFIKSKKHFEKKAINFLFAFFQVIIFYSTILMIVKMVDMHLLKELNSFDLNGDGIFSENEITPEQEQAMNRVIRDTGRNFAPITGALLSFLYFPFAIKIEFIIDSIVNKLKIKKNA